MNTFVPDMNVSFYNETFTDDDIVHLNLLLDACVHRLRLYKILKANESISLEELKEQLRENSLRHLLEFEFSEEVQNARNFDRLSHWVMKVLYSETYPEFFQKCESRWFKIRLNNMPYEQRAEFFARNLRLIPASDEEKTRLNLTRGNWYKFHFTEATILLKRREFPIHMGYLYIPENKLVFIAQEKFEVRLVSKQDHCRKMMNSANEILVLIKDTLELVKPYDLSNRNVLKLKEIPSQLSLFPLCMQTQYVTLKRNKHLRHDSRVQYGLFLKGLGLSVEDAIEMWRSEFTPEITEEDFQRKYVYYIKHLYGLVGGKINYSPQNCDTILESTVAVGLVHGCPFKHFTEEALRSRLIEDNLSKKSLEDIIDLRNEKKYKTACTKYFKHLYRPEDPTPIDHPVTYYSKACENCAMGGKMADIEDMFSDSTDSEEFY